MLSASILKRARRAGVGWPPPADMDDVGLEALLFPPPPDVPADLRPMPDWAAAVSRDAASERHAGFVVEGVSRRDRRRVWLLVILRSVSGVGRPS